MKLLGYWRSSATYRLRIILGLKGLAVDYEPVNLLEGRQRTDDYLAQNPQGLVPTFITEDGAALTQSTAIAEFIEERFPEPPLLPDDLTDRARVRAIASIIACEGQPFMNLRVQQYLKNDLEIKAQAHEAWLQRWGGGATNAVEQLISQTAGKFCFGDQPTLADAFLVPHVYASARFKVDLSNCPKCLQIVDHCNTLEAFQKAHPDQQPDAPAQH